MKRKKRESEEKEGENLGVKQCMPLVQASKDSSELRCLQNKDADWPNSNIVLWQWHDFEWSWVIHTNSHAAQYESH